MNSPVSGSKERKRPSAISIPSTPYSSIRSSASLYCDEKSPTENDSTTGVPTNYNSHLENHPISSLRFSEEDAEKSPTVSVIAVSTTDTHNSLASASPKIMDCQDHTISCSTSNLSAMNDQTELSRHVIHRHKTESGNSFTLVRESDGAVLLYSYKQKGQYIITRDPRAGQCASLQSNFLGNKYVVTRNEPGVSEAGTSGRGSGGGGGVECMVVNWHSTMLQLTPSRGISVLLPRPGLHPNELAHNPISKRWDTAQEDDSVILLKHAETQWDRVNRQYYLDFGGRVTEASSKNFMLQIPELDHRIVFICGRHGKDSFVCDFVDPLNEIQAFAIALSSFDFKICNAF